MFNMLIMRSAPRARPTPPGVPLDDLTARSRIRDAAILRFARDGFGASIRAVATDAGVSPALVIHHFGSKEHLRAECDAYVLARIREGKREDITGTDGPIDFLAQFGRLDEYAPLMGYAIRSLQAGGEMARSFVEHIADDAYEYIVDAVVAGTIVPSRDERARARYLTAVSLGPLLIDLALYPPDDPGDLRAILDRHLERIALPAMELFTEGFMADTTMLDSYLEYRATRAGGGEHAPPS